MQYIWQNLYWRHGKLRNIISSVHSQPSRILCFVGGPCTIGPGLIVSTELNDELRSHTDIKKGNAKYYKETKQFYDQLIERLIKNKHTFDLFACCLDQVGLLEMENLINQTGGIVFSRVKIGGYGRFIQGLSV